MGDISIPADLRFGNRRVTRMYAQINDHRQAVASGDVERIQQTWDKVEDHLDFAYQEAARAAQRGT